MKKLVSVKFGSFYYNKFSKPIREKKDLVLLLLDTFQILEYGNYNEEVKGNLVVRTEKMSRIFYFLENKYFSIVFPFALEEKEDLKGAYNVYDAILDIVIDSRMISLIRSTVEMIDFEYSTMEKLLEDVYFNISGEEYCDEDIERCWNIILRMFSVELGYIRYDNDPIHMNGDLHPLNHLDINYSVKGTYKLGLKKEIKTEDFINLLDIKTKCSYVI